MDEKSIYPLVILNASSAILSDFRYGNNLWIHTREEKKTFKHECQGQIIISEKKFVIASCLIFFSLLN